MNNNNIKVLSADDIEKLIALLNITDSDNKVFNNTKKLLLEKSNQNRNKKNINENRKHS